MRRVDFAAALERALKRRPHKREIRAVTQHKKKNRAHTHTQKLATRRQLLGGPNSNYADVERAHARAAAAAAVGCFVDDRFFCVCVTAARRLIRG